ALGPAVTLVGVTWVVAPATLAPRPGPEGPGAFVTFTVTVHDEPPAPPAGTCRLFTVMTLPPAVTVVAAAALAQVPPTVALARIRLGGRVSTKPTFDRAGLPAALVTVNVNTVVPPALIVVGENALFSEGGGNAALVNVHVTRPFGMVKLADV